MMDFMRAGGFAMWVVLLFGMVGLGTAGRFAFRPSAHLREVITALSHACLFATLSGIVSGFAAVGFKVPERPEWAHSPDLALIVMTGIAESLCNGILGFTILALMWMLTAAGTRKLAV